MIIDYIRFLIWIRFRIKENRVKMKKIEWNRTRIGCKLGKILSKM